MSFSRIRILPYKQGSASAQALADELEGKVLKLANSKFVPRHSDLVINWGNTRPHPALACGQVFHQHVAKVLNDPTDVIRASNKLKFFQLMEELAPDIIPKFWTNPEEITNEDYPIVSRTVLSGHSGIGISIAADPSTLVPAPLYVKYVKKQEEYRVHIAKDNRCIAIQRKARDTSNENPNWQVRNHSNGFIFVRGGFTAPDSVVGAAAKALTATGLDFGAVDVIWNEHHKQAYVLEINTAPGLEGQTVLDYSNYFKEINDA